MSLRIATNVSALRAQKALAGNKNSQDRSMEKLASGQRINRASDDAAGLAISEKLRANIRSMRQAERNANDGISLVQVAEGGLNEINNTLIRLRELSIQSASDTIGDPERAFIEDETTQLKLEIERIARSIEFNGTKLLDGSFEGVFDIQVGVNNDEFLDRLSVSTQNLVTTLDALGINEVSNAAKESAQNNLAAIDAAILKVNSNRSNLGALQNRLATTINNLMNYQENLSAAKSRIADTDMAFQTSELVKSNILTTANISVLAQANQNAQQALQLLQ